VLLPVCPLAPLLAAALAAGLVVAPESGAAALLFALPELLDPGLVAAAWFVVAPAVVPWLLGCELAPLALLAWLVLLLEVAVRAASCWRTASRALCSWP
jgi:hypothetical protein